MALFDFLLAMGVIVLLTVGSLLGLSSVGAVLLGAGTCYFEPDGIAKLTARIHPIEGDAIINMPGWSWWSDLVHGIFPHAEEWSSPSATQGFLTCVSRSFLDDFVLFSWIGLLMMFVFTPTLALIGWIAGKVTGPGKQG